MSVHGTAAARVPGMGENPETFSSPARCARTLDFGLNSSNSYSLNCVDCFPGACIIVSIERKVSMFALFAAELKHTLL